MERTYLQRKEKAFEDESSGLIATNDTANDHLDLFMRWNKKASLADRPKKGSGFLLRVKGLHVPNFLSFFVCRRVSYLLHAEQKTGTHTQQYEFRGESNQGGSAVRRDGWSKKWIYSWRSPVVSKAILMRDIRRPCLRNAYGRKKKEEGLPLPYTDCCCTFMITLSESRRTDQGLSLSSAAASSTQYSERAGHFF